jgi:hypothetical protein
MSNQDINRKKKKEENMIQSLIFYSAEICCITGRGLLKWRLRKLLFDAKIQFLAKEKRESTTKLAILANRC